MSLVNYALVHPAKIRILRTDHEETGLDIIFIEDIKYLLRIG